MQLLQKGVVLHASAGKGDENDGAAGFAHQPDFRKGRVLFGFPADAVVGIEKHDVRAVERAPLAYSPRTAPGAGRHWLCEWLERLSERRRAMVLDEIDRSRKADTFIDELLFSPRPHAVRMTPEF